MILQTNVILYCPLLHGVEYSCDSGYISDSNIFIKEGYTWDGCTLAIDTKRTYDASLVHDFLYEYKPVTRSIADKIFYNILQNNKFRLSLLYYIAVRLFGTFYYTKNNV